MEQLIGTGVALVTPFSQDGSVDVKALESIVEHCVQGGIDYMAVLGTTAEAATLSRAERQLVMEVVARTNAGRLPLVVGLGGNHTAAVVEELKGLDLSEFVAVLSVCPYYNKPTQEGIYRHFKALAEASPLPIILYNVPSRTACNMQADTTLRLAQHPNIVGIKEASGDMVQIDKIIAGKPRDFLLISGDDFTALATALAGGSGVISVLGQGLPAPFSKMMALGLQGNPAQAYVLQRRLLPLMSLIFEEGNPAGIKSVLSQQGLCTARVRLPLVEASPALDRRIQDFLRTLEGAHV